MKRLTGVAAILAACLISSQLNGQNETRTKRIVKQIATIHWQRLPLRDAIARLHTLFDEVVFVDRRLDPERRVSLDIEASSAKEVVAAIAADHDLSSTVLSSVVYLGPMGGADLVRS